MGKKKGKTRRTRRGGNSSSPKKKPRGDVPAAAATEASDGVAESSAEPMLVDEEGVSVDAGSDNVCTPPSEAGKLLPSGGDATPTMATEPPATSAAATTRAAAVTPDSATAADVAASNRRAASETSTNSAAAAVAVAASPSPRFTPRGPAVPPPPPAIPPPPAPAPAPTTAPIAAPTVQRGSSAILVKGRGLCLGDDGILGSASESGGASGVPTLSRSTVLTTKETDLSTPEKLERIDLRDAHNRLGDGDPSSQPNSPTRGVRKGRTYEEENDGYGKQMLQASRRLDALRTESTDAIIAATSTRRRSDGNAATYAGGAADVETGETSKGEGEAKHISSSSTSSGAPIGGKSGNRTPTKRKGRSSSGVYVPSGPPQRSKPPPPPPPPGRKQSDAGGKMAARIQTLNETKTTTAAQQRAAELANLRRKGIAKIFNKHFTTEAESIARERDATERALAELERQKEELAKQHRAYKDRKASGGGTAEMSQIDAMHAEIQRRRNEVRQKEQETKELYRRYVCQFGPEAKAKQSAKQVGSRLPVQEARAGSSDAVSKASPGSSSADKKGKGREVGHASSPTTAAAANNAAAEFFCGVNTEANGALPLIGPGRTPAAASAAASKSASRHFGSDNYYQGEMGGAVVTPTAAASSSRAPRAFGSDNSYQGQRGGMVVAPANPTRFKSSAKRVLPSVGEDSEDIDIADLQNDNIVRQADLLMAKMMEKSQKHDSDVVPKKAKIDEAVDKFKRDGKVIAMPVGRDHIMERHGSRHAVNAIGTDGQEIVVSRSGGVLDKNFDGDADIKDSEVNWKSYRERDLVPLNPKDMVGEFSKPIQEPELITPKGAVWKRPTDTSKTCSTNAKASAVTPCNADLSMIPRVSNSKDVRGVEGQVSRFLASFDQALRQKLNIDPAQNSFTIHLRGAPCDKSAGNDIKMLISEYGANAKILSLSDETGYIEDPQGLDHEELLRLVNSKSSVSNFDKRKLSPIALALAAATSEKNGETSSKNTISADVIFLAGSERVDGGTIDVESCRGFLKEDGTPSPTLVVEGANACISVGNFEKLQDQGRITVLRRSDFEQNDYEPVEITRSALLSSCSPEPTAQETLSREVDKSPLAITKEWTGSAGGSSDDQASDVPYHHLDLDITSDSISSLGSLGDLSQDDLTVATTTLYNFLRQETENIRMMFEESERIEKETLEASGSDSVHTRQSAVSKVSKESEQITKATKAAELMASKMAEATKWIGSNDSDGEDEADKEIFGHKTEDSTHPGRLYSIHQTGDMLDFGIDSTIKDVRWDAYWSEEYSREYYHEPLTNTTTWTQPPGVRVDATEEKRDSTAPTEETTVVSEETVEVKDFTNYSINGMAQPSYTRRSRSPGTVVSEVTCDDLTPRSQAPPHSPDEFRPDTGMMSRSSSTVTLAQYRLRQKKRRRKRRRRAIALLFVFLFIAALALHWKGAVIVPMLNELSNGRIADTLIPLFGEEIAWKLYLARQPAKEQRKTGASKPRSKNSTHKKRQKAQQSASSTPPLTTTNSETSKNLETETVSTTEHTKKEEMKKNKMATPRMAKGTSPGKADNFIRTKDADEERKRRKVCNIPFAYLFFWPCWRESRELPLDVDGFLHSSTVE